MFLMFRGFKLFRLAAEFSIFKLIGSKFWLFTKIQII
jgi:hypothetical protein